MALIPATMGIKLNGLYRHGALTGESFPTVTPPSTDYRDYGSELYDAPNPTPPPYVTNRGTIISDLFGAPFQTPGTEGEPWTTGDATPQISHPDGTTWADGPIPFRTDWTAGASGASMFCQVVRKTGETSAYTEINIETKNAELWGKVSGTWRPLTDGGSTAQLNVPLFGSYWTSSAEDSVATPSMLNANLGRQRWDVPASNRILHVIMQGSPRPVIPAGTTNLFARVWMRLGGEPGTARPFMGLCGALAYASGTAGSTSGTPWVVGRWKTITPNWQPFTGLTMPIPAPDPQDEGFDFWTAIRNETDLPNTVAVGSGW